MVHRDGACTASMARVATSTAIHWAKRAVGWTEGRCQGTEKEWTGQCPGSALGRDEGGGQEGGRGALLSRHWCPARSKHMGQVPGRSEVVMVILTSPRKGLGSAARWERRSDRAGSIKESKWSQAAEI
jgi:hypothetical protein